MITKVLLAFLLLPGIFAFLFPCLLVIVDPWIGKGYGLGVFIFSVGLIILSWCIRDFYVSGKGTLAPWNPPRKLVMVGLYRFSRNPMYIGVLTIVSGLSLFMGSLLLLLYAICLAIGFHLRVIWYEEPKLLNLFASEWRSYSSKVPRWLPLIKHSGK